MVMEREPIDEKRHINQLQCVDIICILIGINKKIDETVGECNHWVLTGYLIIKNYCSFGGIIALSAIHVYYSIYF